MEMYATYVIGLVLLRIFVYYLADVSLVVSSSVQSIACKELCWGSKELGFNPNSQ